MFNIAIVDDEPEAIKILENYLARFSKENGCEFHSASYKNPVAFLENSKQAYDLVFLDIEMPDMSGMDAARKFREYNVSSALIFVTNMAQYAIEGYSVNADDFIVKPISYYDFAMKLARVLNKLNRREVEKVTVNCDGMYKLLPLADVRYVEVHNHTLVYHAIDGVYETRGVLKRVESLLTSNDFVRCNNYCLVNLRYVAGVKDFTVFVSYGRGTKEREEMDISHPRKKSFIKALGEYIGEMV